MLFRSKRSKRKKNQYSPSRQDAGPPQTRSFFWGDTYDRYEAQIGADTISWHWNGPNGLGGSVDQPIEDFLAFGPKDSNAPADIVAALRDAIATRDASAWEGRLDAANQLKAEKSRAERDKTRREQEAHEAAVARHREVRSWKDPWRSYEPAPGASSADGAREPVSALLAPGALVFTASAAIPLACESLGPLLARVEAVVLPILFGALAARYWSKPALFYAGLLEIGRAHV